MAVLTKVIIPASASCIAFLASSSDIPGFLKCSGSNLSALRIESSLISILPTTSIAIANASARLLRLADFNSISAFLRAFSFSKANRSNSFSALIRLTRACNCLVDILSRFLNSLMYCNSRSRSSTPFFFFFTVD